MMSVAEVTEGGQAWAFWCVRALPSTCRCASLATFAAWRRSRCSPSGPEPTNEPGSVCSRRRRSPRWQRTPSSLGPACCVSQRLPRGNVQLSCSQGRVIQTENNSDRYVPGRGVRLGGNVRVHTPYPVCCVSQRSPYGQRSAELLTGAGEQKPPSNSVLSDVIDDAWSRGMCAFWALWCGVRA